MVIFGKQASQTLFLQGLYASVQNILANPIISEISFFMTSSLILVRYASLRIVINSEVVGKYSEPERRVLPPLVVRV